MKNIKILDCTLRDGGYVNNWNFGKTNIKKIISNLNKANIDIIECGFWRDDIDNYDENKTIFKSFNQLYSLDKKLFSKRKQYTLMVLTEKCDITKLEPCNQKYIDTIRLSFHKKDMKKGISDAYAIKEKGYKLFLQPTATMRYSDEELLELIKVCNEIKPESVAIVDTFGEMQDVNIIYLTRLFDKNLDKSITLSFHSHNNIQTAFSNSLHFINNVSDNRKICIDSSIFGMGRGAGNLCTELITDYLNKNCGSSYQLLPLLEVVDNILSDIKKEFYWGYSLEYYLSAINHCHPNYCIYFSDKNTLTTSDLFKLVGMISEDKKTDFNKEYAEELYVSYSSEIIDDEDSYKKLSKLISNRPILLLGPGKSITEFDKNMVDIISNKNYFVIGVNNNFNYKVDAYFISNRKRYSMFNFDKKVKYLCTSNIDTIDKYNNIVFNYRKSLVNKYETSDNSLLMLLNILKKINKTDISLIGFDGYEYNQEDNYYDNALVYLIEKNTVDKLNLILKKYINYFKKDLDIKFLTKSKYQG
ncbi:MAG: aldolase catalytic domain-containing protein [Bacilli bacterium]|nr:aldolase catalytic domain-containing protein [Bacilli bacterium]